MAQGQATKEEAKSCSEALGEVMQAFPKNKAAEFIGHFNDIALFLSACERELPAESKAGEQ